MNQQQSNITQPEITTPKGGGAIHGLGDQFQANSFTGAAGFSIPFPLTTARGFEPSLSVAYNSGGGNGLCGMGGELSISGISRKTSNGIPKYDGTDIFMLDGNELVPKLRLDATTQQWVPDTRTEQNWQIINYRPRIESSFSLIEHWQEANSPDSYWVITTGSNQRSIYGLTATARIADVTQPRKIFSWLPERENDDKGNIIHYCYEHDEDGSYAYLKSVDYGNYQDGDKMQFAFSAVVDYGTFEPSTPDTIPTGYVARPDPFSSFVSGFEIRISRLVHRVLLYHRFTGLYGGAPFLVKSMELRYGGTDDNEGNTDLLSGLSFLRSISVIGYQKQEDGSYKTQTMPPVELTFTSFSPCAQQYRQLHVEGAENIPGYLTENGYQLIDLNNDGLPGFLYSNASTSLYYEPLGEGIYKAPAVLHGFPSERNLAMGTNMLTSLAGNGVKDLVVESAGRSGYYKNAEPGNWNGFEAFANQPTELLADGRQWVDLTGDGLADLVLFEPDTIKFYPSLRSGGYGVATRVPLGNGFPAADNNSEEELLTFAGMLGDGLEHYIRIRNGVVECWPSMGYGHFGTMRRLQNAPYLESGMDVRRLRLADIDGSGTTDIVYLEHDHIIIWFNQCGNRFSDPVKIPLPVGYDQLSQVSFADVNGTGTSCIIITVTEPEVRHYYYDFAGGKKPYLLETSKNNIGASSRYTYTTSVKQYLRDKRNGRPWPTRLFFPVHVVASAEIMDEPSGAYHIQHYAYHDGYYDPTERTFRGFGFVETWDTDHFAAYSTAADNAGFPVNTINEELHATPVYTKSWYHNGAYVEARCTTAFYEQEYFNGDTSFYSINGQLLEKNILSADAETLRQAYAAMEGQLLRQEVYGPDGTDVEENPFTVSETELFVRMEQPRHGQRYAVFLPYVRQSMSWQYERNPADPRVTHSMSLLVDQWGAVTQSCSIYYPRRADNGNFVFKEQQELKITLGCSKFVSSTQPDSYYISLPFESTGYEVTGAPLPAAGYFAFEEVEQIMRQALEQVIDYHEIEAGKSSSIAAWLYSWQQQHYWNDGMTAVLPLGSIGTPVLSHHSETAVYPIETFNQCYNGLLNTDDIAKDTGYISHDDYYWNAGLTQYYFPQAQYYLGWKQQNDFAPVNNISLQPVSSSGYDSYYLRAVSATIELAGTQGITTTSVIDYRTMQPWQVTDPNGTISEVMFDPLGYVVVSTMYGTVGDKQVGFLPLSSYNPVTGKVTANDILANPQQYLQNAGSYFYYDLFSWVAEKKPVCAIMLQPQLYASQIRESDTNLIKAGVSFSDGFSRALVAKTNTDPGSTIVHDRNGNWVYTANRKVETIAQSRWVCTGRTVYNNKGNAVQQFQPYFSDTWEYETVDTLISEKEIVPPSVLHYDALDRVIRTDDPKGFFSKTTFTPWDSKAYDANDTVLDSPYYLQHKGDINKIKSKAPNGGTSLPPTEVNAIKQAIACYNSPATSIYDTMGRSVRGVADNLGAVTMEKLVPVLGSESAAQTALDDLVSAGWLIQDSSELGVYWLTETLQPYTEGFAQAFTIGGTDAAALLNLLKQGRLTTLQVLDITGRNITSADPRLLWSNLTEQTDYFNFRYLYAMNGGAIQVQSADAGNRTQLQNIFSGIVHNWDARGFHVTIVYDQLQRKVQTLVAGGDGDYTGSRTAELVIYGEYAPNAATDNMMGQTWQVFDDAGVVVTDVYGIAGEPLAQKRCYRADYKTGADWNEAAQASVQKEQPYAQAFEYNALGLPLRNVSPDGSVYQPTYNIAGQLVQLDMLFAGDVKKKSALPSPVTIINDVAYDVYGQPLYMEYGNGTATRYTVEATTQRLINQKSYRTGKPDKGTDPRLQEIHYTYDPTGNVTARCDNSWQNVFNENQLVEPLSSYTYDLIYQLAAASGRQKKMQQAGMTTNEQKFMLENGIPQKYTNPNDSQALENYTQTYAYDEAGNMLQLKHNAGRQWTWNYGIAPNNNRMATNGKRAMNYDSNGNLATLENLSSVIWNYRNELAQAAVIERDNTEPDAEYYQYDSGGNRVRKVTERLMNGGTQKEVEEKLYLGSYIYKRITQVAVGAAKSKSKPAVLLEKQSLKINGPGGLCCITHNWIIDVNGRETKTLQRTFRYQYNDMLNSVGLETNAEGQLLSYEEYYPYGGTAFTIAANALEITLKEYRYSGQEKDNFTGLYYYGMRYYPPWLCRWMNPDPAGTIDGLNLYAFVSGTPITRYDVGGMKGKRKDLPDVAPGGEPPSEQPQKKQKSEPKKGTKKPLLKDAQMSQQTDIGNVVYETHQSDLEGDSEASGKNSYYKVGLDTIPQGDKDAYVTDTRSVRGILKVNGEEIVMGKNQKAGDDIVLYNIGRNNQRGTKDNPHAEDWTFSSFHHAASSSKQPLNDYLTSIGVPDVVTNTGEQVKDKYVFSFKLNYSPCLGCVNTIIKFKENLETSLGKDNVVFRIKFWHPYDLAETTKNPTARTAKIFKKSVDKLHNSGVYVKLQTDESVSKMTNGSVPDFTIANLEKIYGNAFYGQLTKSWTEQGINRKAVNG